MEVSPPQPIVITGVGVLACNGIGREAFWEALEAGRSGIGFIDRFDTSEMPSHVGGQLWDFDPQDFMSKANVKRWRRTTRQAIAATKLAIEDAVFDPLPYDNDRVAVGVGTSMGTLDEMYESIKEAYDTKGWRAIDKLSTSTSSAHSSTANIAAMHGFRGPSITLGTGCATGLDILSWGAGKIRDGLADAAVVGTTEAPLEELHYAAACSLGIVSRESDDPTAAMKPFDRASDGLVLSEAAVIMVLERRDRAESRGAPIFGEIGGFGSAGEGRNPLILERDGKALARAIEAALDDADLTPQDIDCAHCHGVSLTNYDRCETHGYKRALGEYAYRVPLSANKSMIGQAYSCGGMLNVASALMSLERGIAPTTLNHTDPDEECDLDYVPGGTRLCDAEHALVTALSYGGTHAAAVFRRAN